MKNKIIVICGFSGSGKDSIVNILSSKYIKVISNTTRPIRVNEKEGVDYFFKKNKSEFFKEEYIEYREYNTIVNQKETLWYYGIPKKAIKDDSSYIIVVEIEGLKSLKKIYGDRITSFFIQVDSNVRKERVKVRGDFDELEWNRRLKNDNLRFPTNIINKYCDYVIENKILLDCIHNIENKLS